MKRKNGFTLIELLAVIVILAIIALIAVPVVLNMIENARKNAAKSSALGYIDSIEYGNGIVEASSSGDINIDGYYSIEGTDVDVTTINNKVKSKGEKPVSGTITVENGIVTNANICVEGYTVVYDGKEVTKVDKGCNGSSTPSVPTIATCPGCKFLFTTSTLTIGSSAPTGTVDDYTTLTSSHPYFLGLITDDNNIIQRAFACGIENEKAFCIEGNDNAKYTDNVNILNGIFNNCSETSTDQGDNGFFCMSNSRFGPSAFVSSNGSVTVFSEYDSGIVDNSWHNSYCGVATDNSFGCEYIEHQCIGHDIDGTPCP